MKLRCRLADHSQLRIIRQSATKTKKGSEVRYRRRLFIKLALDPRRYDVRPDDSQLRRRIAVGVRRALHDPPEGLSVRLRGGDEGLTIKLTQEDTPILVEEVVEAIEAALTHTRRPR